MPREVSLKFPKYYDDNTEEIAGITCCICCSISAASKWICCCDSFCNVIAALINFYIWVHLFFWGVNGNIPLVENLSAQNTTNSLWHAYLID